MTQQAMVSNVHLIFHHLKLHGIALEGVYGGQIRPESIVNGHREHTIALLWKIIFRWRVSLQLPSNALLDEIEAIVQEHKDLVERNKIDLESVVCFPLYTF
jgi:hypothetical protein